MLERYKKRKRRKKAIHIKTINAHFMFLALEVTFPKVKKTKKGRVIESYLRFKNSPKESITNELKSQQRE